MKRLLLALLLIPAPLLAQTGQMVAAPFVGTWRGPVDTVLDLPECTEASVNDVRVVEDEGALYVCTDKGWALASGGGADLPVCEEGELLVANALGLLVCAGLPDHEHTLSDVTGAGTAASRDVPAAGDATATEVVLGSDSRLSDAREPTAHAASHGDGGSDEVTLAAGQVTGLDDSHAHTSATASLSVGEAGEAHAEAGTLTWDGCTVSVTAGVATITCDGGGVEVPGSGSELLHRVDGETLGAVAGSSVSGGGVGLGTDDPSSLLTVRSPGAGVDFVEFQFSNAPTISRARFADAFFRMQTTSNINTGPHFTVDLTTSENTLTLHGGNDRATIEASAQSGGSRFGRVRVRSGGTRLEMAAAAGTTRSLRNPDLPGHGIRFHDTGVIAVGEETGADVILGWTNHWLVRGSDGVLIRSALDDAPASQDAACTLGEIRYTATHKYFCIADGNWGRIAWDTDW